MHTAVTIRSGIFLYDVSLAITLIYSVIRLWPRITKFVADHKQIIMIYDLCAENIYMELKMIQRQRGYSGNYIVINGCVKAVMVVRSYYIYNENPYTGKAASLLKT